MTSSSIWDEAQTESYLSVARLVDDTVRKFVRLYGGDYEELRSEASLLYVRSYHSHVYGMSTFAHWVRIKIWRGLQESMRSRLARNNRLPRVQMDLDAHPGTTKESFDLSEFLHSRPPMTDDARLVIKLVVRSTVDVSRPGLTPSAMRRAVRRHLRGIGWDRDRVNSVFTEIHDLL